MRPQGISCFVLLYSTHLSPSSISFPLSSLVSPSLSVTFSSSCFQHWLLIPFPFCFCSVSLLIPQMLRRWRISCYTTFPLCVTVCQTGPLCCTRSRCSSCVNIKDQGPPSTVWWSCYTSPCSKETGNTQCTHTVWTTHNSITRQKISNKHTFTYFTRISDLLKSLWGFAMLQYFNWKSRIAFGFANIFCFNISCSELVVLWKWYEAINISASVKKKKHFAVTNSKHLCLVLLQTAFVRRESNVYCV